MKDFTEAINSERNSSLVQSSLFTPIYCSCTYMIVSLVILTDISRDQRPCANLPNMNERVVDVNYEKN